MLNYVLSFRERLISRHNTLAQATDASCYCARWTPSFYQLPSSQANYQPHPPMFVSVKRTNIAFTSCYFAVSHKIQVIQIALLMFDAKVNCLREFFLD